MDKDKSNIGYSLVNNVFTGEVAKFVIEIDDDGIIEKSKSTVIGSYETQKIFDLASTWVIGFAISDIVLADRYIIGNELMIKNDQMFYADFVEDAIKASVTNYIDKQLALMDENDEEAVTKILTGRKL